MRPGTVFGSTSGRAYGRRCCRSSVGRANVNDLCRKYQRKTPGRQPCLGYEHGGLVLESLPDAASGILSVGWGVQSH